ncbi:MAG: hypothetical protein IT307_16975, partial [Chloroflexi bacterium]|nr:hypothetical protein [Chloroflexota bacterium]
MLDPLPVQRRWPPLLAPLLILLLAACTFGYGRPSGGAGASSAPSSGGSVAGPWQILAGDRTQPGQFSHPSDVALDSHGNVYVADLGNHRVQKLSPAGQPLAQWGGFGAGPGQFSEPRGIALDGQGNLYVADGGNHRIQKLSPAG